MWDSEPGSLFNVEFWPVYISSTRGIATQEGVPIQQRYQNSTAKEDHNSTKNPLKIDPGSVFNWGSKFYLTPERTFSCRKGNVWSRISTLAIVSIVAIWNWRLVVARSLLWLRLLKGVASFLSFTILDQSASIMIWGSKEKNIVMGISYKLWDKDAIGGRSWYIGTKERKICNMEF